MHRIILHGMCICHSCKIVLIFGSELNIEMVQSNDVNHRTMGETGSLNMKVAVDQEHSEEGK